MKRGQITVFIALGAIMLIIVLVLLSLRSGVFDREKVPQEVLPVKEYVDMCVEQIGKEAVVTLGFQGGYIEVPERFQVESHGVLRIPYWYQQGRNNYPSIAQMEEEISDHMKRRIGDCLANLSALRNQFDIEESGVSEVKTDIGDDTVNIEVIYPMKVSPRSKVSSTDISRFSVNLPVRLKLAWELGVRFLEAENEDMFLEKATLELMTIDPQIPFTDFVFSCSKLRWSLLAIKRELQGLLYFNMPKARVKNTVYPPFDHADSYYRKIAEENDDTKSAPGDSWYYWHMFWDVEARRTSMRMGVSYQPEWDLAIAARPSEGDTLKSNQGKGLSMLSFMCMQVYHFTYDVQYPLMVTIRDDSSFDDEGYTFQFIVPVQINHNYPDRSYFGNIRMEPTVFDEGFCSKGKETNIFVMDAYTNEQLKGANVTFTCMKYYCPLGLTKPDANAYRIRATIPQACYGGFLDVTREGYLNAVKQVDDKPTQEIRMIPLISMDLDVVKHLVFTEPTSTIRAEEPLQDGEKVYIIIEHANESIEYSYTLEYPGDTTLPLIADKATYDLNLVFVTKDGDIAGGYQGNWTVEYSDLAGRSEVKLKVADYRPTPIDQEDQEAMAYFLYTDENYKEELEPELT